MASTTTSRAPSANRPLGGQTQVQIHQPNPPVQQAVLHLRGAEGGPREREQSSNGRRIQWAEDVVDNEGMGKKTSKVCCIYHAPKGIDESSDESSSDSSSDSDSGDGGAARPSRQEKHNQSDHDHNHGKGPKAKGTARKRSPNAYEKVPKPKRESLKGKPA